MRLIVFLFMFTLEARADLKDLQTKIINHLARPEVHSRIELYNTIFDKACQAESDREPVSMTKDLNGGVSLKNYEEVLSRISRFEFPSYEALIQSNAQGLCDQTISLNAECSLYKFDRDEDGAFSNQEEAIARQLLKTKGLKDEVIEWLVKFYKINGRVCLSPKTNSWHTVLNVSDPEASIELVFMAAELVLKAMQEKKSVCFHCAAGKHRTGLTSILVEFADAKVIDDATSKSIYDRYYRHAWYGDCETRIENLEIVPLILESAEFLDFRTRWQALK